ncbi:Os12g0218600 [Oryza sativa Japonica Group]|uniref:Expressed protein n=2 Tax=Oryza sativa subsp. japonica TaxID=39947 RepID=Q2QVT7_ORYSJ|nr:expressed protein [Oryza sativa Japonica Group]EEE59655.1 hypothetical protein OsJ_12045 [Oryza sativa Japonica Group]BAG88811.1 unnamed protein product [Oryza sativa Japonica Group]BAT16359.1 Os12g0218600 [Oryza sativa Japonica Group]
MPSRSRTRGGDGDGDGDGLPAGDLKPGVIRNLPTFSRLLINKWPPVFRQRFSYPFRCFRTHCTADLGVREGAG